MINSVDSSYRRYTATEIDAANDADLPDLLASLGYQIRRVGSYYTTKEMDSLRIWNRRTWYRYSESTGGDAVAFLRHFHGMSFQEAVRYLLAFNGYPVDSPIPPPRRRPGPSPRRERRIFVLPRPHSDNRRVCTYLRSRGIAPGIIDDFIEAGLLYEDGEHHNCVFIGRDRTGKPVFAAKRGTGNIPFKCDVAGSDKRIAFRLPCDPALDTACVFESPIDLMSWITLYGRANALALCGLHDAPLETYLHDNPHVRRIIFCLDADGPGREAAEKFGAKYRALGYGTEERMSPVGKDWNEYLQYHIRAFASHGARRFEERTVIMDMKIRTLAPSEREYTYSAFQNQGRDESTGCIGHLRADFGSGGEGFYSTWWDHIAGLKSQAFKGEIDEVINALRTGGFLAGRDAMVKYCYSHPEAGYGNDREWGVRVDTESYAYLMRLNPHRGEYNLYCYCYERDRLDRHLQAERTA